MKVKVESESFLIGLMIDLICLAVDWASPIQLKIIEEVIQVDLAQFDIAGVEYGNLLIVI